MLEPHSADGNVKTRAGATVPEPSDRGARVSSVSLRCLGAHFRYLKPFLWSSILRGDEKYSFGYKNFCLRDLALSFRREDKGLQWAEYIFIPCHMQRELVKTGGANLDARQKSGGHGPLWPP